MPQLFQCFQIIHKFRLTLLGLLLKLLKHFKRKRLSPQLFPIFLQLGMNSRARSNRKLKPALRALQIRAIAYQVLPIQRISYLVDTTAKFTILISFDDFFPFIHFISAPYTYSVPVPSAAGLVTSSGAGKVLVKEKANGVGPCARKKFRRSCTSVRSGICPAGTHHRAIYGLLSCTNHSRRRRITCACALLYTNALSASSEAQTDIVANRRSSMGKLGTVEEMSSDRNRQMKPG